MLVSFPGLPAIASALDQRRRKRRVRTITSGHSVRVIIQVSRWRGKGQRGSLQLDTSSANVSRLLQAWSNGDKAALDQLTPIVYKELLSLARRYLQRERAGHSLQATALVNEAYVRLVDYSRMQWQDRAHFFAVSAQLMRRILVDHARRRNLKRGGGVAHLSLDEVPLVGGSDRGANIVALDDALSALAQIDPRKAQVVELRFFGGLSVEESAEALKISAVTVMRDWSTAKAWLYREMTSGAAGES